MQCSQDDGPGPAPRPNRTLLPQQHWSVSGPLASLAKAAAIWQPPGVHSVPRKRVTRDPPPFPGFWLNLPCPRPGTHQTLPAPRRGGGRRCGPRLRLPPPGRVPLCNFRPYSLPGAGTSVAGGTCLTANLCGRAGSAQAARPSCVASWPSDDLLDDWLAHGPSVTFPDMRRNDFLPRPAAAWR